MRTTFLAFLGTAMVLATACGGNGGPTGVEASNTLSLTSASLSVNGETIQTGSSFQHNDAGVPAATRFEARLEGPLGPAPGHRVEVRFQTPGGMMRHEGVFHLYDDGTHGDRVPGDGLYCFEDADGAYGFCHRSADHGPYHYDFCGLYPDGRETNHWTFEVTVVD